MDVDVIRWTSALLCTMFITTVVYFCFQHGYHLGRDFGGTTEEERDHDRWQEEGGGRRYSYEDNCNSCVFIHHDCKCMDEFVKLYLNHACSS